MTISFLWLFYLFLARVGVGELGYPGIGRIDIFFYIWGVWLFATLNLAALHLRLPLTKRRKSGHQKENLSSKDVLRRTTFWSFFFVYLANLMPGMGLKLLSGPIVFFTYGFLEWR